MSRHPTSKPTHSSVSLPRRNSLSFSRSIQYGNCQRKNAHRAVRHSVAVKFSSHPGIFLPLWTFLVTPEWCCPLSRPLSSKLFNNAVSSVLSSSQNLGHRTKRALCVSKQQPVTSVRQMFVSGSSVFQNTVGQRARLLITGQPGNAVLLTLPTLPCTNLPDHNLAPERLIEPTFYPPSRGGSRS